jgi:hypothetical protein
VSKASWALVWGETQSLAYICVLLFSNLIEQPLLTIFHLPTRHTISCLLAEWHEYSTTSVLQLDTTEECLLHANDLSGLLLLYSSLGDAEGIEKLSSLAKENGKNNVAFLCLFMLGKLEDCIQLLVDR